MVSRCQSSSKAAHLSCPAQQLIFRAGNGKSLIYSPKNKHIFRPAQTHICHLHFKQIENTFGAPDFLNLCRSEHAREKWLLGEKPFSFCAARKDSVWVTASLEQQCMLVSCSLQLLFGAWQGMMRLSHRPLGFKQSDGKFQISFANTSGSKGFFGICGHFVRGSRLLCFLALSRAFCLFCSVADKHEWNVTHAWRALWYKLGKTGGFLKKMWVSDSFSQFCWRCPIAQPTNSGTENVQASVTTSYCV